MVPLAAHAEPRPVTLGGYLGAQFLPNDVELGNSWAADQLPQSGATVGGRATWWALPEVARGDSLSLWLGIEGELQLSMSSTGSDLMLGRHSYASPILGTNVDAIALLHTGTPVEPLFVVGGGLNTMFTSSPFAQDDTDPVVYYGLGARWGFDRFAIRVDLRQGIEASRMGGETSTFTCVVAIEKNVTGVPARPAWRDDVEPTPIAHEPTTHPVHETTPPPPPPPKDTDGDGIPDSADKCPMRPRTRTASRTPTAAPTRTTTATASPTSATSARTSRRP